MHTDSIYSKIFLNFVNFSCVIFAPKMSQQPHVVYYFSIGYLDVSPSPSGTFLDLRILERFAPSAILSLRVLKQFNTKIKTRKPVQFKKIFGYQDILNYIKSLYAIFFFKSKDVRKENHMSQKPYIFMFIMSYCCKNIYCQIFCAIYSLVLI